jgi:hypothetical protein
MCSQKRRNVTRLAEWGGKRSQERPNHSLVATAWLLYYVGNPMGGPLGKRSEHRIIVG